MRRRGRQKERREERGDASKIKRTRDTKYENMVTLDPTLVDRK